MLVVRDIFKHLPAPYPLSTNCKKAIKWFLGAAAAHSAVNRQVTGSIPVGTAFS